MNCDLCNNDVSSSEIIQIPLNKLQQAVRDGFNPFINPEIDTSISTRMNQSFGISEEKWFIEWRTKLMKDTTDWSFCQTCNKAFLQTIGKSSFKKSSPTEIEIEANSINEARKQVQSQIPQGLSLLSERIIMDGKPRTVKAIAETTDLAFRNAFIKIPSNADILERNELIASENKVITIEALSDEIAREQIRNQISDTAVEKNFKLVSPGKKGLLGIGRKPNRYEVDILQQSVVQVIYKLNIKIAFKIGKWSPVDPKLSCNRPFSDLLHVFIFSDEDGKTTLTSPEVICMLQDSAETQISEFVGHVPIDIIGHSDAGSYVRQTHKIPDSVWTAISKINPTMAEKAKTGVHFTGIRHFEDPITKEQGILVLLYRL